MERKRGIVEYFGSKKKFAYNPKHPHCGPGNSMSRTQPSNPVDAICWRHDLMYGQFVGSNELMTQLMNPAYRFFNQADSKMISELMDILENKELSWGDRVLANTYLEMMFVKQRTQTHKVLDIKRSAEDVLEIDPMDEEKELPENAIFDVNSNTFETPNGVSGTCNARGFVDYAEMDTTPDIKGKYWFDAKEDLYWYMDKDGNWSTMPPGWEPGKGDNVVNADLMFLNGVDDIALSWVYDVNAKKRITIWPQIVVI